MLPYVVTKVEPSYVLGDSYYGYDNYYTADDLASPPPSPPPAETDTEEDVTESTATTAAAAANQENHDGKPFVAKKRKKRRTPQKSLRLFKKQKRKDEEQVEQENSNRATVNHDTDTGCEDIQDMVSEEQEEDDDDPSYVPEDEGTSRKRKKSRAGRSTTKKKKKTKIPDLGGTSGTAGALASSVREVWGKYLPKIPYITTPEGKLYWINIEILKTEREESIETTTAHDASAAAAAAAAPSSRYHCTLCPSSRVELKKLRTHIFTHHQQEIFARPLACLWCNEIAPDLDSLSTHYSSVHNSKEARNKKQCEICGKTLSTSALKAHMAVVHFVEVEAENNGGGAGAQQQAAFKLFRCDICGKPFREEKQVKEHRVTHMNTIEKLALTHSPNLGPNDIRLLPCSYCEKSYVNAITLKHHEMRHRNERPFVCELCGAGFITKGRLKEHAGIHTGTTKRFPCSYDGCTKTFQSPNLLVSHTYTHGPVELRPHLCQVCGTRFISPKYLKQHMKKHTGERPFGCKYCTKFFKSFSNRARHARVIHNVEPSKLRKNQVPLPVVTIHDSSSPTAAQLAQQ